MIVNNLGMNSGLSVQTLIDMRNQLADLHRQLGTGKRADSYAGIGLDRGLTVGLFGLARIDVGERGIRSAEIDPDIHPATRSRTLNSSFQRRPSLATHQSWSMPVSVTTVSSVTRTTWPS